METQDPQFAPTGIKVFDALVREKEPEIRGRSKVWRFSFDGMSRYFFDLNLQLTPEDDPASWVQFDTESDAWYFGRWIQRRDRMILCYAEGDITLTLYDSAEAYDDALVELCERYEPAAAFTAFDFEEKTMTRYYEDRRPLFYDSSKYDAFLAETKEEDGTD